MKNLNLKGCRNVRDLGNIKVDGGIIKSNMLYRGNSLDKLTEKDTYKLESEYRIRTIIDLRTSKERDNNPNFDIENALYRHMPIFDESVPGITHEGHDDEEDEDVKKKRQRISLDKLYRDVLDEKFFKNVREIITYIVNLDIDEYPVLFHCTEGKDRTGIIAAVILLILGASDDDIVRDYLYTNKINKKKANKFYWNIRLKQKDKKKAIMVKDAYLAKEEYIRSFLDEITIRYGNRDNFIDKGLLISRDDLNNFRKRVIG